MANSTTTAPSRDFQQDYRDLLSPYDYDSTESLFADLQSNTLGSGLMNDTASGVTVTDLGIMQSPEWENVEYFKTFLRQEVVDELEFIERDFINADLFGNSDGLLTDAELVTYVNEIGDEANVDLANADDPLTQAYFDYAGLNQNELFGVLMSLREAARVYFYVLPHYLSQPTLTEAEFTRLCALLNYHGKTNAQKPEESRITHIYGIPLEGFPITFDRRREIAQATTQGEQFLIRLWTFMHNPNNEFYLNLSEEEWAGVRMLLMTYQYTSPVVTEDNSGYQAHKVEGAVPFNHEELVVLTNVLDEAANRGDTFHGMVIALDLEKDEVVNGCLSSVSEASAVVDDLSTEQNERTQQTVMVLQDCQKAAAQATINEAEYVSAHHLYMRAKEGMLTASEVTELRTWMRDKAREYDLVYVTSIPAAISEGAESVGEGIYDNPGPFIASNVAFIGTSIALNRMMEKAFLDALTKRCGGEALSAGARTEALRTFRQFQAAEMAKLPFAQRMALRGANHWITGLAAFNLAAMGKDHYIAPVVNEYSPGADWMAQEYRVPLPFTDADFGVYGDTLWFDTMAAYAFYRMHNLGKPGYPNFLDGPGSTLCRPLPPVEVPVPVPVPAPEPVRVPNGGEAEPTTELEPIDPLVPTYTTGELVWVGTTFAVLAIVGVGLLFVPFDGPFGEAAAWTGAAARGAQFMAMWGARATTASPALVPVVVRYR